jgi:hypothetical protein
MSVHKSLNLATTHAKAIILEKLVLIYQAQRAMVLLIHGMKRVQYTTAIWISYAIAFMPSCGGGRSPWRARFTTADLDSCLPILGLGET